MQRTTMLWAGGGAAALLALLVWAFMPRPVEVEVAVAAIGPFETTIDEDARTRVRDKYVVSAPLAGRLQRITLREGDPVRADAVLALLQPMLSPMLDERTLQEQQARVSGAQAGVQLALTRINGARVAVERARTDLQRTEQLAQQGFVAPTKIDADRLAQQGAEQELQAAIDAEHIARHELQQASAALSVARAPASGRAGFELRAPVAGQVLRVLQGSETAVAMGAPVLEIGDIRHMEIVAELLTTDALLATPGAAVRIERWGGPSVLQGRVRRVEPAAFTKVSALGVEEQRVNVLIDITSPSAEWAALGDGYRVGVRIVTRSEKAVLRVPASAVFPRPDGAGSAVFVVVGGRARQRAVTLEARNGSQAWIREGLEAGATVIVYPPPAVEDGVKVQARRT